MLDEYKKCIEACYLCAAACDDARVHKTGYAVCKYLSSCSSVHGTE